MKKILRGRIVVEGHQLVTSNTGILLEDGVILGVGDYDNRVTEVGKVRGHDYDGILCPGLINSHTHLELSTFRYRDFLHKDFVDWVMRLVDSRSLPFRDSDGRLKCATAKQEAEDRGTAFFVNVGNDFKLNERLGDNQLFQFELLGVNENVAEHVYSKAMTTIGQSGSERVAMGIHAPYSVSPQLMKKIKYHNDSIGSVTSIHLAETSDEVEFIRTGNGRIVDLLDRRVGSWKFSPNGLSPVKYVDSLGILDNKTLCAHCVCLDDDDVRTLAERRSGVAVCVRSNRFLSGEVPPLRKLLEHEITLTIGTDSTASSPDIDMFAEVSAFYHEFHGLVSPTDVMKYATTNAAIFLGKSDAYGSISVGKRGPIIFVPFDGARQDAVEFLVTEAVGKTKVVKC